VQKVAQASEAVDVSKRELVPKSFISQCLAFPGRVEQLLAEIGTVARAKDLLDKAATMQHYAERLKAGIEVERPIALGVLKIKAKLGELAPAKPPKEKGRGKKNGNAGLPFSKPALSAYRKLAANSDRLDEYYEASDDVPTQTDFIRYCGSDGAICTKHGNNVIEWYTPEKYIEAARKAMTTIDLDPATSEVAQKTVRSATYYTAQDDGLAQAWAGNVFLNPPYKMPLVEQFCFKLCDEYQTGDVAQAVLLVNDNTDTKWWHRAANTASVLCFSPGARSHSTTRPAKMEFANKRANHILFWQGCLPASLMRFRSLGCA